MYNNLVIIATSTRALYATSQDGRTIEAVLQPDQSTLGKVYDLQVSFDGQAIYLATESGLYRSAITPPWQWHKTADLPSLRLVAGLPDKDILYLLTFDSQQNEGKLYYWESGRIVQELGVITQLPYALVADPSLSSSIAAYILLDRGEVLAAKHDKQINSLGKRPSRWFAENNLAHDLVVTQPSEGIVRLWMGHSEGLLEYRAFQ